jgi:hypothetical protein
MDSRSWHRRAVAKYGALLVILALTSCSTARHLAQLGEADARAELAKAWTVTIYERAF